MPHRRTDSVRVVWKSIVAGLGSAATAITALQADGTLNAHSIVIVILGALSTGLATYAKSNYVPPADPPTQNIPNYAPPPQSGLPTAYRH